MQKDLEREAIPFISSTDTARKNRQDRKHARPFFRFYFIRAFNWLMNILIQHSLQCYIYYLKEGS